MAEFELFYNCEDNGDGSASARFFPTKKEAEKSCEDAEYDNESAGSLILKYENGKLYYRAWGCVDNTKKKPKFDYIWIEIKCLSQSEPSTTK